MALELKPASQILGSSVRKAREALKQRANEILDLMIGNARMAAASGDFETAHKAYQFLIEHLPDDDGQRVIDISVDKPKQLDSRPSGPIIQFGDITLGGVHKRELAPITIEAEVLKSEDV